GIEMLFSLLMRHFANATPFIQIMPQNSGTPDSAATRFPASNLEIVKITLTTEYPARRMYEPQISVRICCDDGHSASHDACCSGNEKWRQKDFINERDRLLQQRRRCGSLCSEE